MGQSRPFRPIALVVEDDADQRSLVAALIEEVDFDVIECDSAEAAMATLRDLGDQVSLVFTDIRLAGSADGVDLAQFVHSRFPDVRVVVTSGNPGDRLAQLPSDVKYLSKPWLALEVLREAENSASRVA